MDEYFYCYDCEESMCQECEVGFWDVYDEDDELEIACPCCGSIDVSP